MTRPSASRGEASTGAAAICGRPSRVACAPAWTRSRWGRSRDRALRWLLVAFAVGGSLAARAHAQDSTRADSARAGASRAPDPGDPRITWTVDGRVVRPERDRMTPVPGMWVVLHRVGSDTAGPLDSMRTRADGGFHFAYHHRGSADAVYFLSASYDGIAYFSSVLRDPHVRGDAAEIEVFDTTSGPLALHVQGHHVVVGAPRADGMRELVEVYDLSNDSSLTFVSPDDRHPTFAAVLPEGATQFEVGQSDVSPSAIRAERGRVEVVAPFAPGLKQLSFAYRLPSRSFPLSIPIERTTTILEVLLEEPAATVSGGRLSAVDPVSVEGRSFRRFLAHDVPAHEVLTITVPVLATRSTRALYVMGTAIAVGAAMLIALATAFARRTRPVVPVTLREATLPMAAEDPESIARTIAALDAAFERRGTPDERERNAYRAQRDALKHRLAVALDAARRRG